MLAFRDKIKHFVNDSGIEVFYDQRNLIFFVSGIICLAILALLVSAMVAWSISQGELSSLGWATGSINIQVSKQNSTSVTAYFGLRGYSYGITLPYYGQVTSSVTYSSSGCTSGYCGNCKTAGDTVLGLLIVSFLLMFAATIITKLRAFDFADSSRVKLVAVSCEFASMLFTVVAYGSWNTFCLSQLPSSTKMYNGMAICITAWILMLIVLCLNLLTPVHSIIEEKPFTINDIFGQQI